MFEPDWTREPMSGGRVADLQKLENLPPPQIARPHRIHLQRFISGILRRKVATFFRGLDPEKMAPAEPQNSEAEEARSQELKRERLRL